MGYKRPARVIFLGPSPLVAAAMSAATELGADWLEPNTTRPPASGWADLVITLDASSQAALPALPGTTRHKHWPAQSPEDVRKRVAGMLGGMRLLARLPDEG